MVMAVLKLYYCLIHYDTCNMGQQSYVYKTCQTYELYLWLPSQRSSIKSNLEKYPPVQKQEVSHMHTY